MRFVFNGGVYKIARCILRWDRTKAFRKYCKAKEACDKCMVKNFGRTVATYPYVDLLSGQFVLLHKEEPL